MIRQGLGLACALVLINGATAHATTIAFKSGSTSSYEIRSEAANDNVRVRQFGANAIWVFSSSPITDATGTCTGGTASMKTCTASGPPVVHLIGTAARDILQFEFSAGTAWRMEGGGGGDSLTGGDGNDSITGGPGTDAISGGLGADVIDCAGTVDNINFNYRQSGVTVDLTNATDDDGEVGDRLLDCGAVNIFGTAGADTITGGDGRNEIGGRAGVDLLRGGGGDDFITGGAGEDVLVGGAGRDVLHGGEHGGANDEGVDLVSYEDRPGPIVIAGPNALPDGDQLGSGVDGVRGTAAGDTLGGFGVLEGAGGDDALVDAPGPSASRGGPGTDTVTYAGQTTPVRSRTAGELGVGTDTDVLADVERLVGSEAGDDLLAGAPLVAVDGGGGDDVLRGTTARETFSGGAGRDTASYADAAHAAGVTAVLDGSGEDVLAGVERLEGSAGPDRLTGGSDPDVLDGGAGDDVLDGRSGPDDLVGGDGRDDLLGGDGDDVLRPGEGALGAVSAGPDTDTVSFEGRTTPVTFALTLSMAAEALRGGGGADVLTGTAAAERIAGLGGDDTITGGGGADRIEGGDGRDLARYDDGRSTGVVASLVADPRAEDELAGVEDLTGGPSDDLLTGDGGPNRLDGGDGVDLLAAGAGDDVLLARDGKVDRIECGDGADDASASDDADERVACELPAPPAGGGQGTGTGTGQGGTAGSTTGGSTTTPPAPQPEQPMVGRKQLAQRTRLAVRLRGGRVARLVLTRLPAGARVSLDCTGRGCPKPRTLKATRSALALTRFARTARLRPGSVLRITVTAPRYGGRLFTVAVRKGKAPKRTTTDLFL